jgi:hypothetical protein
MESITIKDKTIRGKAFAWDECHKIYIIKRDTEIYEALSNGYVIYPMEALKDIYKQSCPLKFISSWDLTKNYIDQRE